jgi:hypothetical protein
LKEVDLEGSEIVVDPVANGIGARHAFPIGDIEEVLTEMRWKM